MRINIVVNKSIDNVLKNAHMSLQNVYTREELREREEIKIDQR